MLLMKQEIFTSELLETKNKHFSNKNLMVIKMILKLLGVQSTPF